MKRRCVRRITIFVLLSVVIFVTGTVFLFISRDKETVKVNFSDERTDLDLKNYQTISLLCRPDQMTNVWLVAIAVKDGYGTYQYLNQQIALIVTGNDPFSLLNSELTIYSNNQFILHGDLVYYDTYSDASDFLMLIQDWDIVYPIRTTLRPFFLRRFIYHFDYTSGA